MANPNKQTKTIFKIDFEGTLAKINSAIDQLPQQMKNGRLCSAIKGNVTATAIHIYRLYMRNHKKSARINTTFKTFNPSLAKVSKNSERTVQRHILKLLKLNILIAKDRLARGLNLTLNRALLVFKTEEVEVKAPAKSTPSLPASEIALNPASAFEILKQSFTASLSPQ